MHASILILKDRFLCKCFENSNDKYVQQKNLPSYMY